MAADETTAPPSIEGPGKGKPYFDRAKTVAESGNYDYAIDMFIEGLNREPLEVSQHEALFRVSLERKVKGGKPAGGLFGPKTPLKGKGPKEQMLNAEWLLAKDPGNITHIRNVLRGARDGGYAEVIKWLGPKMIIANKQKPNKDIYLELAEMYRGIREFHAAADAIQLAIEMAPLDLDLQQQLKDVSAEAAMIKGGFDKAESFKESLKDTEKTKELLQEDALSKSREYRVKEVDKARVEYEANPLDHRAIAKYALALRNMEEEPFEAQAVEILSKSFDATKTYQYKRSIDEIRMRQYRRHVSALREEVRFKPEDAALKEKFKALLQEQIAFELTAYRDWAQHYPTDMGIIYELGIRLFVSKRFDEAIEAFQQSQANPKHRTESLYYLGLSFDEQKMLPEATDTLRMAVDEYELAESGNEAAKRLWYALARIYEKTKRLQDAAEIYSKITRWDIGYKDARVRLAEVRKQLAAP